MTYGEIYSSIISIIYEDTTEPASIDTLLHGSEGVIARKRKRIMEAENLSFMEKTKDIYVAEGVRNYDLPDFKEEIEFKFIDTLTGDYYDPLIKIRLADIDKIFKDYSETSLYPTHYYIDFNIDSSYDRFNLYPLPGVHADTVTLSANAEEFSNTAFKYFIDASYEKAAASNTFSSADTINTGASAGYYWGVWLVQINASGTISTKPGGGLSDQVYTSELNAINALPEADANNWPVGYITVESNSGVSWTANTDDLVSDANTVNFYNTTALLRMRYWKMLDDLSDTKATFDATEDILSIRFPDAIIWQCVKYVAAVQRDIELLQIANENIIFETNNVIDRNFSERNANSNKIPYRSV